MKQILVSMIILIASASFASACPSCVNAIQNGDSGQAQRLPLAYNTSILFMLSMPFILLSGFGFAFYRLSRQASLDRNVESILSPDGLPPSTPA